jgi:hypothetical protein
MVPFPSVQAVLFFSHVNDAGFWLFKELFYCEHEKTPSSHGSIIENVLFPLLSRGLYLF